MKKSFRVVLRYRDGRLKKRGAQLIIHKYIYYLIIQNNPLLVLNERHRRHVKRSFLNSAVIQIYYTLDQRLFR